MRGAHLRQATRGRRLFLSIQSNEVYPRETERHRIFREGVLCVRHHGGAPFLCRAPVLLRFDLLEISRIRETTSERRDAFFSIEMILNRSCAFWRVLARFSKGHALQAARSRRCP